MREQPNFVYIFCDELRADALGCYVPEKNYIHTPNIDALAAEGIRYENCYCNSPVCVPSRASLLTGLYPEEIGVYQNEASIPPFEMQAEFRTIPSVLAQNGYQTASFGKTHLPWHMDSGFSYENSDGSEMTLGLQGFDEAEQVIRSSGVTSNILGGLYPNDREFHPAVITENAVRWMKEQDDPFFVRISYLQPHTPVIAPRRYASCDGIPFDESLGSVGSLSHFERHFAELMDMKRMPPKHVRAMKRDYFDLVAWVDEQVGVILESVKQIANGRDTIVIFNSDHGVSLGENASFGKMTFNGCAQKVPLIIAYVPDQEKGTVVQELCSNIDLGRTIFGLAQVGPDPQFGGRDLLKEGPSGEVYASIGYGSKWSFPFGYDAVGDYKEGCAWPRRACLRRGTYRLDMNVRINSEPVPEAEEDLFFTDSAVCPEENVNLCRDPRYEAVCAQMRQELLSRSGKSVEIPDETLYEIRKSLEDRSFFRYLIQATEFNDRKR